MDEDQVQQTPAVNEPVVPANDQPDSPPVEPQPAEKEPTADPPADEPADEAKPSRAERRNQERESRIRELNAKVRQYEQGANQPAPGNQQPPQFPSYQEGEEVSPQRLQQDVVQAADAIASIRVQQQLGQARAVSNFERDNEVVPQKYAELNPESPDYNNDLDEAIALEYQERAFVTVGYDPRTGQPIQQLNPSVRLADVAERLVKVARSAATKSSAAMKQVVAETADATAPRPGGDKPASREFKDLSIEEMEQQLGIVRR